MSKSVKLTEKAYAALMAQKRGRNESLSQVILRFVPPTIRPFGDLEKHLETLEGSAVHMKILEEIRTRKRKSNQID